ncbi:hypothetical protein L1049_002771 [Liquidambar formosana]|uniref:Exocyst subunit Exo70 family protein n=1 Tax=Liquidambar formosana TaxID=63359 RepID=A0AAP0R8F7_LIQFO
MAKTVDGDERVIATAQQIVKSLGTSKNVKEDMIFILSNFGNRFSAVNDLFSSGTAESAVEERLRAVEEIIYGWETNSNKSGYQAFLFSVDSADETAAYLSAVDEVVRLSEDFATAGQVGEVMDRAENVIQVAMGRLEDEFRHILISNIVPFDADLIHDSIHRFSNSFNSNNSEVVDFELSIEERPSWEEERGRTSFGDMSVDLINPDAIDDLKDIVDRMIKAGYEKECCQVYTSVRRDVLDECLSILGVEKLSIDEVHKIEWVSLDGKMKKWSHGVKIAIRVILVGEKRLWDQIFVGSERIREVCFNEIAKGSVMQLMTFAEAITIGQLSPEKLFRILDMYDALAYVLPDLESLFYGDSGEFLCSEARELLAGLGEAAKGTFSEFDYAIKGETSKKPIQGGEIHPLSRYVMNYVRLLVDYSETLNLLLVNIDGDLSSPVSGDNDDDTSRAGNGSPLAQRLLLVISSLESNLDDKSKLYEDEAMKYVFLMNNVHYLVQKVKGSELGTFLGDQWVRKHRGQIRQYATCYLRACWSKVLSCLKDEGIGSSGSSSNVSKMALKERFKNFNLGFEEVYKNQTTWKVPDPQLREELRISISEKVIPAYRSFLGRFQSHIEGGRHAGKYIKYTPEDLENYLLDFFEGSAGIMHHPRRKLSGERIGLR